MRRLLALLAAAVLAAACHPPENPAERYERFAKAARAGDTGAVWSMLSRESQERIRARARALGGEKAAPGVDVGPAGLVLGDLAPTAPKVKSVTVLRESQERAVVAVDVEGGQRGEVTLVREGKEWKVVLPEG
jgi:hypothetical protein